MNRRQVLSLCGVGLAGLAGCQSGSDEPGPTETPTGTVTQTPTGPELSVRVESLQPATIGLNVDALTVGGSGQFLYLALSVTDGDPPARSDLTFRFDGREHSPVEPDPRDLYRAYTDDESVYKDGQGWTLFELPEAGDASDAALVWPGGEWQPGDQLRARLSAPEPPLSLSWTVPDTVVAGSQPTLEFAVTNDGDHVGQFVGGLNRKGWEYAYIPLEAIRKPIPAGETTSWTVLDENGISASRYSDSGENEFTYQLAWTGGGRHETVQVVEESSREVLAGGRE
jgi:hypothetical protein